MKADDEGGVLAEGRESGARVTKDQQLEIRLTVNTTRPPGSTSSGDLVAVVGGTSRADRTGGCGDGLRERQRQERALHAEEVAQAVERLVIEHGVGGATTFPAAFAVRPRSPSFSSSSSSSSSAGPSTSGFVREKLVTLVTAALNPASLDESRAHGDIRSDDQARDDDAGREACCPHCRESCGRRRSAMHDEALLGEALGEVCITVPSTLDKDLMLSQSEHDRYVMNVVQRLVSISGRVTAVPAMGFWMLETPPTATDPSSSIRTMPTSESRLMQERVTIVCATCVVDDRVRAVVKEVGTWLATALGQEAVFVKINNRSYLIRADPSAREAVGKRKKWAKKRRPMKQYQFFHMEPTMVYDCNYQAK